ncbi:MAG: CaiB/BaiF CoA transferase family protein [Lautropia sp.]
MKPLEGLRIVDFTEGAQGPFAASLLGDLGAEVVKVERPGGELMRHIGPFRQGVALPMLSIARSRHATVSLDVKQAADRAAVHRLLAVSDLLIQNWKPGTDARLGLSFEQVRAIRPTIIYVRASGYGTRGPFGTTGSMDSLSQAISGLSSLSGDPAGEGEKTRTPILDFVSAFVTAEAALVGLASQRRTGKATLIDTSQFSAALDAAAPEVASTAAGRVAPAGRASRYLPLGGWFRCADDVYVCLECRDAAEVGQALECLGAADGTPPQAAVDDALSRIPSGQAIARLRGAGLPARAVERSFHPDLFAAFPGTVSVAQDEVVGEIRHPETPFLMTGTPPQAGGPLGPIGRDNPLLDRIIAQWGTRPAALRQEDEP